MARHSRHTREEAPRVAHLRQGPSQGHGHARRGAPAVVSVGVVLAIAVCVVAAWALSCSWGAGGTPTTDGARQEAQAAGPSDGGAGAAAEPAQGGEGAASSEDPRAAEFAVDPDAHTEWNYKNNGEKVVYLTFDDGPSKNTQRVLDILDRYGAKATFFVVGHDPDHYDMIKRAYDDGNTIGLHSYTHDYARVYSSESAFFDDLDQIAQVVKDQIGYVPCFIRFPGGSSNTISERYSAGIMDVLVDDVQQRGYQYFDWNASSGDGAVCTTEQIVENSCAYDDYPNIILLCHDAATKDTTVEALPAIIEHYQALGYRFCAIDRSTMVPHHKVAN